MRKEIVFLYLAGLFLVSLVVANAVAAKLFVLFGVTLSCGVITYPITFLATDLVSELYGERRARSLVFAGFVLSIYLLIVLKLGQYATPAESLNRQAEYEVIFGSSVRAIAASMVAYLFAQFLDVRMFHFWKRLTMGKHLWLRNNASTVVSQLIDSSLVVSILFYGVLPQDQLIALIIASWLFKLVVAATDTPFFYYGARYLGALVNGEAVHWRSLSFWRDFSLALATLANIALLIAAALLWEHAGGFTGLSVIMLIAALFIHILTTVGLAKPQHVTVCAYSAAACTSAVTALAARMTVGYELTFIACAALLVTQLAAAVLSSIDS